jgi:hypothetical protein
MLIEGCYNLIDKCLYSTSKCITVSVWFGSKKVLPEVAKIFSQINIFVVFYTCIQNQVIHKHVNIQLMTFDEVNTRIDQPMEHDIHRGIGGEYHVPWVDQSLYSPKWKVINCFIIWH